MNLLLAASRTAAAMSAMEKVLYTKDLEMVEQDFGIRGGIRFIDASLRDGELELLRGRVQRRELRDLKGLDHRLVDGQRVILLFMKGASSAYVDGLNGERSLLGDSKTDVAHELRQDVDELMEVVQEIDVVLTMNFEDESILFDEKMVLLDVNVFELIDKHVYGCVEGRERHIPPLYSYMKPSERTTLMSSFSKEEFIFWQLIWLETWITFAWLM